MYENISSVSSQRSVFMKKAHKTQTQKLKINQQRNKTKTSTENGLPHLSYQLVGSLRTSNIAAIVQHLTVSLN